MLTRALAPAGAMTAVRAPGLRSGLGAASGPLLRARGLRVPLRPAAAEPPKPSGEEPFVIKDLRGTPEAEALLKGPPASVPAPVAATDASEKTAVQEFLSPSGEQLNSNFEMPIWDHLEELRERVLVAALAAGLAVLTCFIFSKDLVLFLEAPVVDQGVRFLQLSPGEFFFTTLKVAGYAGILMATPTVLYEIIAYIVPGLTASEKKFLAPVILGSSVLFYFGLLFSYEVLTPAALTFFVDYADGAVESLWSIDQYFEFVLVLMLSTGLAFQVPVIQVLLGNLGLVTSQQMLSQWRYVVVGATVAAAVLTPSTDPFTQSLLAIPLVGLYMGGAFAVKAIEASRGDAIAEA